MQIPSFSSPNLVGEGRQEVERGRDVGGVGEGERERERERERTKERERHRDNLRHRQAMCIHECASGDPLLL